MHLKEKCFFFLYTPMEESDVLIPTMPIHGLYPKTNEL